MYSWLIIAAALLLIGPSIPTGQATDANGGALVAKLLCQYSPNGKGAQWNASVSVDSLLAHLNNSGIMLSAYEAISVDNGTCSVTALNEKQTDFQADVTYAAHDKHNNTSSDVSLTLKLHIQTTTGWNSTSREWIVKGGGSLPHHEWRVAGMYFDSALNFWSVAQEEIQRKLGYLDRYTDYSVSTTGAKCSGLAALKMSRTIGASREGENLEVGGLAIAPYFKIRDIDEPVYEEVCGGAGPGGISAWLWVLFILGLLAVAGVVIAGAYFVYTTKYKSSV